MSREFQKDRVELEQRQWQQLKTLGHPVYMHAHYLVYKVADELARAWYEVNAHDNTFYNFYPSMDFFVRREWHQFIMQARACLAAQLGDPLVPESNKKTIHEALVLDRAIPRPDNAGPRPTQH